MPENETAQQRFDQLYITGAEIRRRLNVAYCTLTMARKRGMLPAPIQCGDSMYVWERKVVDPYLDAWETTLKARRGELATT